MSNTILFKISIPTDNGFFGRECNNSKCKRYFKISTELSKDKMYCPYCGWLFDKDKLWTKGQLRYAERRAIEESAAYITREFDKQLRDVFGKLSRSNRNEFISFSIKPAPRYRKKAVTPPKERQVDSEIECSQCGAKFQVYGIFGYCPICKYDNMLIYDANLSIILREIDNAIDKNKALRHAYNDLVATFENFCKKRNNTQNKYNFQNLDSADRFFQDTYNAPLFGGLINDETLVVKRVFQKRHAYQHNKGKIDQKYIDSIPEDSSLLRGIAPLSLDEFKEATKAIRKILLKAVEK